MRKLIIEFHKQYFKTIISICLSSLILVTILYPLYRLLVYSVWLGLGVIGVICLLLLYITRGYG
ncbi:hypothetical protein JTE87_04365 [Bacillus amyloliquefaciens]|nr:hypothetical protein [Bacillus amyloliquefaciens]